MAVDEEQLSAQSDLAQGDSLRLESLRLVVDLSGHELPITRRTSYPDGYYDVVELLATSALTPVIEKTSTASNPKAQSNHSVSKQNGHAPKQLILAPPKRGQPRSRRNSKIEVSDTYSVSIDLRPEINLSDAYSVSVDLRPEIPENVKIWPAVAESATKGRKQRLGRLAAGLLLTTILSSAAFTAGAPDFNFPQAAPRIETQANSPNMLGAIKSFVAQQLISESVLLPPAQIPVPVLTPLPPVPVLRPLPESSGSGSQSSGSGQNSDPPPTNPPQVVVGRETQIDTEDCETAAAQMVLEAEGISDSQQGLLGYENVQTPANVYYSHGILISDGDPYAGFVGDPDGSTWSTSDYGYGAYPPIIASVIEQAGGSVYASGSISLDQLLQDVAAGHPAVAWVDDANNLRLISSSTFTVTAADGAVVPYLYNGNEHAVAITGVSADGNWVYILNPERGGPNGWQPISSFGPSYNSLQMAVVGNS